MSRCIGKVLSSCFFLEEEETIRLDSICIFFVFLSFSLSLFQSLGDRRRYFFVYFVMIISQIFYEIRDAIISTPDPLSTGRRGFSFFSFFRPA